MGPNRASAKQRILVAGTVDSVHTACAILGDAFEYRSAFSMEEALAVLDSSIELIVCNMRFEDGTLVDFLRALREQPRFCRLPLVCLQAYSYEVSSGAYERLEAALRRFENARLVDLYAVARARGVSAAAAELREVVCSRLREAA